MKMKVFAAGFGGLLMVFIYAAFVAVLAGFAGLVLAPSELWPGVVFGASAVVLCASAVALLALAALSEK